ncbi:MAG: zinc-ribbon domain-containing protein, partial [Blastocatellia bacterium]
MYCPRCGMQNTETTKFCRQCGLSLAQITGFVSSGGTGALAGPPPPTPQPPLVPGQLPETSEMLALKQKRTMTMLAMCILPVVLTIIGE